MTARLDYYARHPFIEQADLDLAGNGDALALHGRLKDVAFIDGGFLPCDPEEIRIRAGVSPALWRSWGRVEKKWPLDADSSRRANAELLEQMNHAREYSAKLSKAGKKGAKKRWGHGPAIPEPKRGHGTPMAIDSKRTEQDRTELDCSEKNRTEPNRSSSVSSVESSSSNGNGKDPPEDDDDGIQKYDIPVRDGEGQFWRVPETLVLDLSEQLLDAIELDKQIKALIASLRRDPSKRPWRANAEAHLRNWLESPVTKEAREAMAKENREAADRNARRAAAHPDQRTT